jgi:hypothetical protein
VSAVGVTAPGSALGRPARRTPGRRLEWHADQVGSHRHADRYSTRAVFLAAHSSSSRPPRPGRSLPVASHAIGYADPGPWTRRPLAMDRPPTEEDGVTRTLHNPVQDATGDGDDAAGDL